MFYFECSISNVPIFAYIYMHYSIVFRMILFLFVPFIHCVETLILFILDLTRQKGTTEELIREIEQKLKHTSQATGSSNTS